MLWTAMIQQLIDTVLILGKMDQMVSMEFVDLKMMGYLC